MKAAAQIHEKPLKQNIALSIGARESDLMITFLNMPSSLGSWNFKLTWVITKFKGIDKHIGFWNYDLNWVRTKFKGRSLKHSICNIAWVAMI